MSNPPSEQTCPKCGQGELVTKRSRRGKVFYGCNRYPDCDFAVWSKPLEEPCPNCGGLLTAQAGGKGRGAGAQPPALAAGAATAGSQWPSGAISHAPPAPFRWIDRSVIVGDVPQSGHLGSRRSFTSRKRMPSAS